MTSGNTSGRRLTIAVDAMGGDYAPEEMVAGAVKAAERHGVAIALVGDQEPVQRLLATHQRPDLPIRVVSSEGFIQEGEPPAFALRHKPRASIAVAGHLVKEGHAQALVTMGSTGAAMAVALLALGPLPGVDRPVLGGPVIGLAPDTMLLDLGVNLDCRPQQLVSFAVLGTVFMKMFRGIQEPKVALLSVGAEEGKGNAQVKATYEMLKRSGLNFIGNLEGGDIPRGVANVIVCDGFVGNILLKFTEGLGASMSQLLKARLEDGEELAEELVQLTNVVESVGGGPLLGVEGTVIIGHGRAKALAVESAIGTAKLALEIRFVQGLKEELLRVQARLGALV